MMQESLTATSTIILPNMGDFTSGVLSTNSSALKVSHPSVRTKLPAGWPTSINVSFQINSDSPIVKRLYWADDITSFWDASADIWGGYVDPTVTFADSAFDIGDTYLVGLPDDAGNLVIAAFTGNDLYPAFSQGYTFSTGSFKAATSSGTITTHAVPPGVYDWVYPTSDPESSGVTSVTCTVGQLEFHYSRLRYVLSLTNTGASDFTPAEGIRVGTGSLKYSGSFAALNHGTTTLTRITYDANSDTYTIAQVTKDATLDQVAGQTGSRLTGLLFGGFVPTEIWYGGTDGQLDGIQASTLVIVGTSWSDTVPAGVRPGSLLVKLYDEANNIGPITAGSIEISAAVRTSINLGIGLSL